MVYPNAQVINGLDIAITSIFAVEAFLKIVAFTFHAYIRVNSNKVTVKPFDVVLHPAA